VRVIEAESVKIFGVGVVCGVLGHGAAWNSDCGVEGEDGSCEEGDGGEDFAIESDLRYTYSVN
jgi:hypothetical protein